MAEKSELRRLVREDMQGIVERINAALQGKNLADIEPLLARLGRGGKLPHWFPELQKSRCLPNLDGKTIGSVIEMLLVAIIESTTLRNLRVSPLRINPARGIDLPDLDLGIKSPSENFCTSEPFFSAYERLLGSEYDALVLLTDYQDAKRKPPLRLQVTQWRYLTNTQLADESLCRIASIDRDWLASTNVVWGQKVFRFLAYVNQSDWRAKRCLSLVENLRNETRLLEIISQSDRDFEKENAKRAREDKLPIPDSEVDALRQVARVRPLHVGVIDACDSWVVESQKEMGRLPNDNEWRRFLASPLDGKLGMSFALQWRFNFGKLFRS